MASILYLDSGLMEILCHRVAVAVFDRPQEPLPPFADHDHGLLDSALNIPRASFGGKELYPTLIEKAAMLYYALNKNHPFKNGNKRMATASLLVFLFINEHWLKTDVDDLVAMTLRVAESKTGEKALILATLNEWLRERVTTSDGEAQGVAKEIRTFLAARETEG